MIYLQIDFAFKRALISNEKYLLYVTIILNIYNSMKGRGRQKNKGNLSHIYFAKMKQKCTCDVSGRIHGMFDLFGT